jgi:prephenate dehydrogenase
MKPLQESRVAIVGIGLMGGSLAGALRGRCQEVVGIDRALESLDTALALGYIDRGVSDLAAGLRGADLVVLATPVRTIIRLVGEIGPLLGDGTLLMDLGSTKAQILKAMAALPDHVQVLGGHPMCGKETAGIAAADPALFSDRTFILSPLPRTSPEALTLAQQLVRATGATPLIIDGARQDYLVGTISHLPYLLACALVSTADATTSADPLVWQIVAGGYRDTSRVAGSDVTMMVDILMTNREEVVRAAGVCQEQLARLVRLVEAGDEEQLREVFAYIHDTRKEMYS